MIIDTEFDRFADEVPEHAWVLHCMPVVTREGVDAQSRIVGLLGLSALFIVVGIAMPVSLKIVEVVFVELLNAIIVGASAIPGIVILLSMMSVCLLWLKACGWKCVKCQGDLYR